MRVYLDVCCYNRPYDDQSQLRVAMETQSKLHIQGLIKEGKLELVGSYIVDYEVSQNPYEMRKQAIVQFVQNNMTAYVGAERDEVVKPIADNIMQKQDDPAACCKVVSYGPVLIWHILYGKPFTQDGKVL